MMHVVEMLGMSCVLRVSVCVRVFNVDGQVSMPGTRRSAYLERAGVVLRVD